MPSFRDLLERRVPQYLAVYLGVGWALVEFISFLEERYPTAVAPIWTDITLFTWALLIPSAALFTYYHGRPGRDRWARAELIAIPLNIIVTAFVLLTAFSKSDLSARVTKVEVTDETGATQERVVARSTYRKRLALFNFDAAPSDTSVAWLREAAPTALATDLSQDIFLDFRVPAQFREQLREAGVGDGHNVPLPLKRKIADDLHLPYFITGAVASSGDEITIRVSVHHTSGGEQPVEREATGRDFLSVIDQLSVQVKKDLDLPDTRSDIVKDLDVVELLSSSPEAVRALMDANSAAWRDDYAIAERLYARATELDPTFALAHFALYQTRSLLGNAQKAIPSLDAAMRHDYRLTERLKMAAKIDHFIIKKEMDKAYNVAAMMTELYPDDLQGLMIRAQVESLRDDKAAMIASLRRMLELDPQQHERLLQIGQLQEATGDGDAAVQTFDSYVAEFPQDVAAQLLLARAQQRRGQLAQARATLDRALLLEPTNAELLLELGQLLRNTGELDAAWQRLEEARAAARTPEDRARVLAGVQSYHSFRGEMRRSLETAQQRLAALAEFQPPIMVVSQQMGMLRDYVRAGQRAQAAAKLEQVKQQMKDALGEFWRLGQLVMAIETRDTIQLTEGMRGVRSIIDGFGLKVHEPTYLRGHAVLLEQRGDWNGALSAYTRQKELEPTNLVINRDLSRCYRMLNRPDEALRTLEELLRYIPMSPETNIETARVKLLQADHAAARPYLDRAAQMLREADADYPPAVELKRLMTEIGAR